MTHRHLINSKPFVLLLAAVAALLFAGPGRAQTATPGTRLLIEQLNWSGQGSHPSYPCSRVGDVEYFLLPVHLPTPGPDVGTYVQLVTQVPPNPPSWSVRNLYVSQIQPVHPSVHFRLDLPTTSGTCIDSILYSVVFTHTPVSSVPLTPTHTAPVGHEDYLVGGRIGGTSGLASTPLTIGPWIGAMPGATVVRTAHTSVPAANIAAINEDENGCAPASAARSIKYLMGNAVGNAQGIYQALVQAMQTSIGQNGTGTTDQNMLAGKNAYTQANGLPIASQLLYGGANFAAVATALAGGADVEILISWTGGGGHAAMVTSMTQLSNGQWQITYVDDPVQGDGIPANKEHTIIVNPNGTFDGGTVDGFMVERRTARGISREFVPTWSASIGSPSWLVAG